ncbi:sodium:solute symporter family protein [Nannocystis bainbridge]|uniref:Na+:solute symporter n=1 Tax=Nannocystis bainbridge TaxID=2995303 RepID=A0ABT5DVI3_9BACT|nr:sodium:solute symporter family protein [Nannocystis bainbridge]MDC0716718.1 Na+:solute symporter [Nannocystis bainbridge]
MLDLVLVLAFVAYSVSAGLRARRLASRDLGEFFLAGRTLRGWQAGASMAATQFAADTPLLVTGLVAAGGLSQLWLLWIYGLSFLLLAYVFAGPWRRAQVVTDAELVELRYGGRGALALRACKALYYGGVLNGAALAMVVVGAVRFTEVFMPWHAWLPEAWFQPWVTLVGAFGGGFVAVGGASPEVAGADALLSLVVLLGFTALYSLTGGLRAVVATDVVQLAIMLIGTALYAGAVLVAAGGPSGITAALVAHHGEAQATAWLSLWPGEEIGPALLVVLVLPWLFQASADGTGYLAQRCMACTDETEARRAGLLFAWLQIVIRSVPWVITALGLLVLLPPGPGPVDVAAREQTFVQGIDLLLSPGARGLMLVAMLAALASTIDTHLNWGASYWSHDVYGRLWCEALRGRKPSGRELVWVARAANVGLLVVALILAAKVGSIQSAWHVSLLFGAGIGAVLILRWLWERINLWCEFAAIAVSLVLAPALLAWSEDAHWRLAVMAVSSTTVTILVALFTKPTEVGARVEFFRRARPPGFWGCTASAAGEDPRAPRQALARALGHVLRDGLALYLALYGAVRVLFPLPGEGRVGAIAALVVSAALVVWSRRSRVE